MYDLATSNLDGDWPLPAPDRTLVLCSTVRSGSTLLGEALHSARGLGCPLEYLHAGFRPVFAQRWQTPSLPEYLRALVRYRTDPTTGVLSVKLFWADLWGTAEELGACRAGTVLTDPAQREHDLRMLGTVLGGLFRKPSIVLLRRADTVRRAVSVFMAQRTGVFRLFSDTACTADVEYDYDAILSHVVAHRAVDADWLAFFAVNGLSPVEVRYEDLLRSYSATVARVLRGLGHPAADAEISPPRLFRQADDRSEAFVRRFLADHQRLTAA